MPPDGFSILFVWLVVSTTCTHTARDSRSNRVRSNHLNHCRLHVATRDRHPGKTFASFHPLQPPTGSKHAPANVSRAVDKSPVTLTLNSPTPGRNESGMCSESRGCPHCTVTKVLHHLRVTCSTQVVREATKRLDGYQVTFAIHGNVWRCRLSLALPALDAYQQLHRLCNRRTSNTTIATPSRRGITPGASKKITSYRLLFEALMVSLTQSDGQWYLRSLYSPVCPNPMRGYAGRNLNRPELKHYRATRSLN